MEFRTTLDRDRDGREGIAVPELAIAALGGPSGAAVRVGINGRSLRTFLREADGAYIAELDGIDRIASGVEIGDTLDVTLQLDGPAACLPPRTTT